MCHNKIIMIHIENFYKGDKEKLILNGVYKIIVKDKDLVYIGSTSQVSKYKKWTGFKLRFLQHITTLINNTHSNIRLQRIVNKYGIDSLEFFILEITEPVNAIIREQYWINYYDSYKNGLNLRPIASSNLGIKATKETKLKISLAVSKSLKEKYSKEIHHMKGYIMPKEHKLNLSKAKRQFSEEEILNIYDDLKNGYSFKEITKKYATSQDTIRRIINGKYNSLDWSFIVKKSHKFNKQKLEELLKYKSLNYTGKQIAEIFNVSQQCISYWINKLN